MEYCCFQNQSLGWSPSDLLKYLCLSLTWNDPLPLSGLAERHLSKGVGEVTHTYRGDLVTHIEVRFSEFFFIIWWIYAIEIRTYIRKNTAVSKIVFVGTVIETNQLKVLYSKYLYECTTVLVHL